MKKKTMDDICLPPKCPLADKGTLVAAIKTIMFVTLSSMICNRKNDTAILKMSCVIVHNSRSITQIALLFWSWKGFNYTVIYVFFF